MGEEADRLIEEQMDRLVWGRPEDDFGEAFNDGGLFDSWMSRGRFNRLKDEFIWTDINGVKHHLADIDNYYLSNIIRHLKKRLESTPDVDYNPGDDRLEDNSDYKYHLEIVIEFLEAVQKERKASSPSISIRDLSS